MKKFLFILIGLVISLSGYSQTIDQVKYTRDSIINVYEDSIKYYQSRNDLVLKYKSNDILFAYDRLRVGYFGKCEPSFKIWNCSKKTIKYITVNIKFYNRVDDPVKDDITRTLIYSPRIVGPIEYLDAIYDIDWDGGRAFYNKTAEYFVITSVNIEYTNKTKLTLTQKQLKSREIDYDEDITYGKYDRKIADLRDKKIELTTYYNNLLNSIKPDDSQIIYNTTATMPSFPGGSGQMMRYLNTHVIYPKTAMENGIQGRVVAQFVVEKDGSIGEVKIARSISPDLDAEAIRVIKSFPNFIPGKNAKDEPVRVWYTIPVTFKLQGAN